MNSLLYVRYDFVSCMAIFVIMAVSPATFATGVSFSKATGDTARILPKRNGINSTKSAAAERIEKRDWEFRTAPIAFIARWLTLDVSYRLTDQWATGPAAILYNADGPGGMVGPTYSGSAFGWNGNYYFSSAFSNTWYVSAHAYYESYKSYPHAYMGFKEIDGVKANSAIGYQWKWSRVNVMAGVGAEFRSQTVVDRRDGDDVAGSSPRESKDAFWLPHIEFKMGIEL
jgi:hypothetical protein